MKELSQYLNHYDLKISSSQAQDGYETDIFKINSSEGESFILKIYDYSEKLWLDLESEIHIIIGLKDKIKLDLPFPIPNNENEYLTKANDKIIRVSSFVKGTFWAKQICEEEFLISLGSKMAQLDLQMATLDPKTIYKRKINWDLCNLMNNLELIKFIEDPLEKKVILFFFDQFETYTLPRLQALPKALIHNDFNPWNILLDDQEIIGLIDFGDMVVAPRINELAIGLAYVLAESDDLLKNSQTVIKAYHQISPLLENELELLYSLIAGRIITSLVNSAHGKYENPENKYIQVSERSFRQLLREWSNLDPISFTAIAYEACNFRFVKHSA